MGSVSGRHCLIAAGTLITPGKEIAAGSVVMGSPGRVVRPTGERELKMIEGAARYYQQRIHRYRAEPGLSAGAFGSE